MMIALLFAILIVLFLGWVAPIIFILLFALAAFLFGCVEYVIEMISNLIK